VNSSLPAARTHRCHNFYRQRSRKLAEAACCGGHGGGRVHCYSSVTDIGFQRRTRTPRGVAGRRIRAMCRVSSVYRAWARPCCRPVLLPGIATHIACGSAHHLKAPCLGDQPVNQMPHCPAPFSVRRHAGCATALCCSVVPPYQRRRGCTLRTAQAQWFRGRLKRVISSPVALSPQTPQLSSLRIREVETRR
jgi:hypothetical protein